MKKAFLPTTNCLLKKLLRFPRTFVLFKSSFSCHRAELRKLVYSTFPHFPVFVPFSQKFFEKKSRHSLILFSYRLPAAMLFCCCFFLHFSRELDSHKTFRAFWTQSLFEVALLMFFALIERLLETCQRNSDKAGRALQMVIPKARTPNSFIGLRKASRQSPENVNLMIVY